LTPATPDAAKLPHRPKRADARRNYEALVAAARDAFAEDGADASLEDVARRAQVGIGTLYRHFPTRQHLLEAVYVDEVEAMCRSAADLEDLPPWDARAAWLHLFVRYAATMGAVLVGSAGGARDAEVFRASREAITTAGQTLLQRAQAAGDVRPDTSFADVGRMVAGIAAIPAGPEQIERILDVALDGLRVRA
jgi:AcrR family transcriptional regulator